MLKNKGFAAIDDLSKYHYIFETCAGQVVAQRCNREFVQEVTTGQKVELLLDKTTFYAEQGLCQLYYSLACEDTRIRGGVV